LVLIFTSICVALTAYYFYLKQKMSFWKRRGIPEDPGFVPLGSQYSWDLVQQKLAFNEMTTPAYKKFPDAKVVGTYDMLGAPSLVIRDLDLAKQILIKDFDQFMERKPEINTFHTSKNNRYFPMMLTELRGSQWKHVRSSLTPAFTSGKLKAMVPLIHKVADNCDVFLDKNIGKSLEAKDVLRNFAMDVIISTGFGYESDSLNEEKENIIKTYADLFIGKKMNAKLLFGFLLSLCAPKLFRLLDIPLFNKEAEDFFAALIKKTIKERQESGLKRNDLIDVCLELLKKENSENTEETELILIANSLVMFLAGFDTVSSSASIMLYFLAKNPECQEKLYQEVKDAIELNGNDNFDYNTIMNMQYMEKFFQECLRVYPLTHIERASVNDYKVPGTDIVIPKGIFVRIPMPAIVKDEKYFPNPNVFDPENFSAEKKATRHPMASGGFGFGPRNCIAQRFATMEVKIVIARILSKYRVLPCDKTVDELIPDPASRFVQPKGDLWVKVEKR